MNDAASFVQRVVAERYGVTLPIGPVGTARPCIEVARGPWQGDPWSGGWREERVSVEGFVDPRTRTVITLVLTVSEHDLSGQIDAWDVRIAGAQRPRELAAALGPERSGCMLNAHLQPRVQIG